jgi:hypothetical protein
MCVISLSTSVVKKLQEKESNLHGEVSVAAFPPLWESAEFPSFIPDSPPSRLDGTAAYFVTLQWCVVESIDDEDIMYCLKELLQK